MSQCLFVYDYLTALLICGFEASRMTAICGQRVGEEGDVKRSGRGLNLGDVTEFIWRD
jgi:hypothetical protein